MISFPCSIFSLLLDVFGMWFISFTMVLHWLSYCYGIFSQGHKPPALWSEGRCIQFFHSTMGTSDSKGWSFNILFSYLSSFPIHWTDKKIIYRFLYWYFFPFGYFRYHMIPWLHYKLLWVWDRFVIYLSVKFMFDA